MTMQQLPEVPAGYLHPFPKDAVPEGWTAMAGNGVWNMTSVPLVVAKGNGYQLEYDPDTWCWCMKDWATFVEKFPEYAAAGLKGQ